MNKNIKLQVSIDSVTWNKIKEQADIMGVRHGSYLNYILNEWIKKGDMNYEYKRE